MNSTDELHVIFGTGPLGLSVARALQRRNHRVRLVNRGGQADAPAGAELLAADVFDMNRMDALCSGATTVYQCANPPYHRWPEEFPPLQGVILDAAARAGARLVIADNVYAYGDPDGRPLVEDMPYNAATRKGRTRAMMAEAAMEAHAEGLLPVTIGRGSDFFGPGVLLSAMGERAIAPVLRGKAASLLGDIDLPHTYTFIDDFGEALVRLGEHEDAFGRVWHVPNAPALSSREFMTLLCEEAGQAPRMQRAGRGMMRFFGLFSSGAREMVEMMYEFEKPFVVDSTRFETAFGMRATPLRDAIAATVAWYRARKHA
ncbi:MAG: NAD-dependent epimerase/dehydratase family protein [Ignavibacteriae bacterium]|nr:NAD-dependent epimerase/dehydratase family protein [Ignavibacteriota bacterium]